MPKAVRGHSCPKKGVLLVNLGTPDTPQLPAVRRYLREFLLDKRVIQLPGLFRYLLVYGFILPFRAPKTAHAYQAIWTEHGSPLRYLSEQLCEKVQAALGDEYLIALGMRYGNPSLKSALKKLQHCDHLTLLPLYPQYASAATGSVIESFLETIKQQPALPSMHIIREFYQHPGFIKAEADHIKPLISNQDHILFSYHGLPVRQSKQSNYREQCLQTSELIAAHLNLPPDFYSTGFQSRLGKAEWIKPYTDELLEGLALRGIKRLAVVCPSFVTDCLETLEEIGIRLNLQWQQLSGEPLTLIPCLNSNPAWVHAMIELIN